MKYYSLIIISLILSRYSFSQEIDNPTFYLDSMTIKFVNSDSTGFPDYFEDQKILDSISQSFTNWHERAIEIEKYQIKKSHVAIQLEGDSRIVSLSNGHIIKLVPDDSSSMEAGYTFEKILLDSIYQLYRVQWFEGNNYFILNEKTGIKTYTIGRAFISPDITYLVSINDDIEAGYSSNGFELFKIGPDNSLIKIWEYDCSWGPKKIKWITNNSLITLGYYFDKTEDYKYKEFYKKIIINVP